MLSRAEELQKLMNADTSEEKDCQPFLHDIALHLVPFRVREENILVKGREESSRPGDSDFCVSVEVDNGAMGRRFAYVWEVKAPQKYLFQQDKAVNRLRPTDDLYSAENQLLNYVAELETSKNFRQKFQLTGAEDEVRLGGIIIGRKDRIVKGLGKDDGGLEGLARNAFTTREAFLWEPAEIRVRTWDWVLEQLQRDEQGGPESKSPDVVRTANPERLLAFAHEMLSTRDELSFRAAVNAAYAAVELKVMSGGWKGGRGPAPRDVVRMAAESAGRRDIAVLFRKLSDIRNRSVHVFDECVTEANAVYAVHAAEEFCHKWDELLGGAGPDGWAEGS
jgi:hypothetical protein